MAALVSNTQTSLRRWCRPSATRCGGGNRLSAHQPAARLLRVSPSFRTGAERMQPNRRLQVRCADLQVDRRRSQVGVPPAYPGWTPSRTPPARAARRRCAARCAASQRGEHIGRRRRPKRVEGGSASRTVIQQGALMDHHPSQACYTMLTKGPTRTADAPCEGDMAWGQVDTGSEFERCYT